ncbi:hypothetical protein AB0E69_36615 [Kribbella sp. NPDC026611]|uniref:hypothetical protein n=1 Tax=Kribbella sp. NPDC026611 TaxID=3154911 RepID=UPI0033C5B0F4
MTKDTAVGSVAEEAAKLFALLQNAAAQDAPPADASDAPDMDSDADSGAAPDAGKHEHALGPDCVWCPVCQLIHRVRNTSPETIEQLSTAAAHVLGSLRSLLEAAADAARQSREDAASRSSAPDQEPVRSRVDRIDVSEDPEPWD